MGSGGLPPVVVVEGDSSDCMMSAFSEERKEAVTHISRIDSHSPRRHVRSQTSAERGKVNSCFGNTAAFTAGRNKPLSIALQRWKGYMCVAVTILEQVNFTRRQPHSSVLAS